MKGRDGRAGVLGRWLPGFSACAGEPEHVAFGTFCHIAAALRDAGLRRWTGPFDWIFSTPGLVASCLDDDFAGLLHPGSLESVPPERLTNGAARQCRHRAYEERYGLPILFNHHDPVRSGGDRRALERAIGRLRDALGGAGANRLYMMSERPWPEGEILALGDRLRRLASRNTLFVLELDGRGHARTWSAEPFEGRPDLVLVKVMAGTRSLGAKFPDPADDAHLRDVLRALAGRGAARESGMAPALRSA